MMTTLNDRYADLLGQQPAPPHVRLVANLDAVHTVAPPPYLRATIAQALQERTIIQKHGAFSTGWFRWRAGRRRPASLMVGAVLVAAVLLVGSVSAGGSLVDRILSIWPGNSEIVMNNLGQQVNLARTACNFTMTIQRVYADANRVVVGYALSGPPGRTFTHLWASPTLSDAGGTPLRPLDSATLTQFGNQAGEYFAADANTVAGTNKTLQLHLTVPSLQALEPLTATTAASVPCETYTNTDPGGPVARLVTINGPYSFDLTVPVTSDVRVADLHQVSQVHGATIVLERVVVTPTETRIYVRGSPAADMYPQLSVDGQQVPGVVGWSTTNGAVAMSFVSPLYDKRGEWTVVVKWRHEQVNGTWTWTGDPATFRFIVP